MFSPEEQQEMMEPCPILADLEYVPAQPCLCLVQLPFSDKTEYSRWDGKQWMGASDSPERAMKNTVPSFIQRRSWHML